MDTLLVKVFTAGLGTNLLKIEVSSFFIVVVFS